MKVRVLVRLKSSVPDAAGELVQARLVEFGYSEVRGVRCGRLVELDLEIGDVDMAVERVERLCQEILANALIEECEIIPEE